MRTFFTYLFILVSVFAKGQTGLDSVYRYYHDINGISIFKIGETKENIIHILIDSMHYSGIKEKNASDLQTSQLRNLNSKLDDKIIYKGKISIDTAKFDIKEIYKTKLSLEEDMFTPGIEKYFVQRFPITDEIALNNIEMFFMNGLLCYVRMDWNPKVDDALKLKYGEPNIKSEDKIITCTYTYTGAKFDKTGSTIYKTWVNKNSDVRVISFAELYYDDNCEKQFDIWMEIYALQGHKTYWSYIGYYDAWKNNKKGKEDEKIKKQLEKF